MRTLVKDFCADLRLIVAGKAPAVRMDVMKLPLVVSRWPVDQATYDWMRSGYATVYGDTEWHRGKFIYINIIMKGIHSKRHLAITLIHECAHAALPKLGMEEDSIAQHGLPWQNQMRTFGVDPTFSVDDAQGREPDRCSDKAWLDRHLMGWVDHYPLRDLTAGVWDNTGNPNGPLVQMGIKDW